MDASRFALIYVLAGLAGSVASYNINSIAIGAGASGAIFGVLGALIAFLVANRDMLGKVGRQTLVAIAVLAAINIFFGFADSGVDNWAHLGGLAGDSRWAWPSLPGTGSRSDPSAWSGSSSTPAPRPDGPYL